MVSSYFLGRRDYREVLNLQKQFLENKKNGSLKDDIILLVEHNPVITIGRNGTKNDILTGEEFLKNSGIDVVEVERGGKVTFHGPGQLVIYPILDLRRGTYSGGSGRDVHKIIRKYEETVIDFLKNYNIEGNRIEAWTGVWVDGKKIASIGIAVSRWITYHGISININCDIKNFSFINPCGLNYDSMISLNSILNREISLTDAGLYLINSFEKVFNCGKIITQESF